MHFHDLFQEHTMAYMDAAAPVEARVEDLLRRMTLAEKIGQVTQVEKNSIDPADIADLGLGSLLSGGGGNPEPNTPESWAAMVAGYQAEALQSRLGIPLIYGVDAVHGHNNVRGATIFPHNIGLGAADDIDLTRRVARATAVECAATGVRWNFAPCIAVVNDVRWGRTFESFGSDTDRVSAHGSAYQAGLQDAGDPVAGWREPTTVLATPKHYLGDGATIWGTSNMEMLGVKFHIDQGDMYIDEATLRAKYLAPYARLVGEGALSIMASFSSWNGQKMHGNRYLLTDVLKGELGFQGFIVSDWMAIDQVHPDFYTAVVTAFNAGLDMNMVPYDYRRFIATLTAAVEKGDVPMTRIDDAVRRILRVKFLLGLFEQPQAYSRLLSEVGSEEHRAIAREAVRKSLVLLQNEQSCLPVKEPGLIFMAGEGVDDLGLQCGGWTIKWQGVRGREAMPGTTCLDGLLGAAHTGTRMEFSRDGDFDHVTNEQGERLMADLGFVFIHEDPYAEGLGDRADLNLSGKQVALIERVRSRSRRVAVILLTGRPLIITDHLHLAEAWVAGWWPGSEGSGVGEVLFGQYPFTGRLPLDWPRTMNDIPAGDILYPRGFGLTTT
jgi:beta-glucosidase